MTPDLVALARRAVACKAFAWAPGMAAVDGNGWVWRLGEDGFWRHARGLYNGREYEPNLDPPRDAIPDLSDACTLGGLLSLVREAWGEPLLYAVPVGDGLWMVPKIGPFGMPVPISGTRYSRGEAEALVSALEAKP